MMIFGSRRKSEDEEEEEVHQSSSIEESPPTPPAPPTKQPIGFETVVGAGCTIDGKLTCNGNIRLDGEFTGTLEITGNVLVGETARIKADINAKNISIAGAVRGNVSGKKVQLLRTGRVWGDIAATALTTEEGAFIDGKVSMTSSETPPEVAIDSEEMATEAARPLNEGVLEDEPEETPEGEVRADSGDEEQVEQEENDEADD